jgi:glycosyltransferase involved in cell wall biosynthesis
MPCFPDEIAAIVLYTSVMNAESPSSRSDRTPVRVVHLSSVHTAFDIRIFHKECRSLARAGLQVIIVAPHERDEIADHIQIRAVPIYQGRFPRITRTVWDVFRVCLSLDADLYHFHDPELIPIGLLLRARGKRVIYDIHEDVPKDILSKDYLPDWSRRLIAWSIGRMETAASEHFSALIAVTPSIAARFLSRNAKTVLVQNFPDVTEIAAFAPKKWEERSLDMVYVGGILAERGIREMIDAMGRLSSSCPSFLNIASSESPLDVVPELAHDRGWQRVRYLGRLDRPQISALLGRARAGLVLFHPEPNNVESMPHKLFEYMAAGIPVIASDFPAWRKLLGPAKCALFVNPLKPKEIAEAIEFIISEPEIAEQMGRNGQSIIRNSLNWDTQAQQLLALYSGLLEPACVA